MSNKVRCFSALCHPCRSKEQTNDTPRTPVTNSQSAEVIVHLRGDDISVYEREPKSPLKSAALGTPLPVSEKPGIRIETETTHYDYTKQGTGVSGAYTSNTGLYTSNNTQATSKPPGKAAAADTPTNTTTLPTTGELTHHRTHRESELYCGNRSNSISCQSNKYSEPESKTTSIVSTMGSLKQLDTGEIESKPIVQSNIQEDQKSADLMEDLKGLQEMISTKYTSSQLAKEQKKLSKLDKTIGVHTGKLQKTRNSISDSKKTPKKQEKELKKVAKAAETIGCLEIEREAANLKVEKLRELITDRQSLMCVVKRNSVQLVTAKGEEKPQIMNESNAVAA